MPIGSIRRVASSGVRAIVLSVLLLAACEQAPTPTGSTGPTGAPASTSPSDGGTDTPASEPACDLDGERLPPPAATAEATVLLTGEEGGPRVEAVVYPHPSYEGNPWSQWGQGTVLPDGRFLSAIGDHLGADGNSYLYAYTPDPGTLALLFDVLSLTDHEAGAWGYGKIHGQMVLGACDEVYFTTYWGTREGLSFGPSYQGDRLFRLDPAGDTIADLGTPVPEHGLPSLAGWAEGGLLYGEASDPRFERDQGPFFAYDVARQETVFLDEDPAHVGFRNVAVDADGRAYFSVGSGAVRVYEPRTGEARDHPDRLPGAWLRASTAPDEDGVVYGATVEPDMLFAIEPSGEIRTIGPARGYTTSMALDPDGERFLYVPGAHGNSYEQGTPLVSVDPETGDEEVLVELNEAAEAVLGLRLGGTYDLAVDPEQRIVYIGMNAGPASSGESFGEVVLIVVHLS